MSDVNWSYTKAVNETDGSFEAFIEFEDSNLNRMVLPDGQIAARYTASYLMNRFEKECEFHDVTFEQTDFEIKGGH